MTQTTKKHNLTHCALIQNTLTEKQALELSPNCNRLATMCENANKLLGNEAWQQHFVVFHFFTSDIKRKTPTKPIEHKHFIAAHSLT